MSYLKKPPVQQKHRAQLNNNEHICGDILGGGSPQRMLPRSIPLFLLTTLNSIPTLKLTQLGSQSPEKM